MPSFNLYQSAQWKTYGHLFKYTRNVTHLKPTIFLRNYYQIKGKNVTEIEHREWEREREWSDISPLLDLILNFYIFPVWLLSASLNFCCIHIFCYHNLQRIRELLYEMSMQEWVKVIIIMYNKKCCLLLVAHHKQVIKHDILILLPTWNLIPSGRGTFIC